MSERKGEEKGERKERSSVFRKDGLNLGKVLFQKVSSKLSQLEF